MNAKANNAALVSLIADPDQTNVTGDPYGKVLANIHKVFDGEMDPTAFEEHARSVFATKAYIIFTMDKLIAALLKHVSPYFTLFQVLTFGGMLLKTNI